MQIDDSTITTITSMLNPVLTAGDNYWFVLGSNTTGINWPSTDQGVIGGALARRHHQRIDTPSSGRANAGTRIDHLGVHQARGTIPSALPPRSISTAEEALAIRSRRSSRHSMRLPTAGTQDVSRHATVPHTCPAHPEVVRKAPVTLRGFTCNRYCPLPGVKLDANHPLPSAARKRTPSEPRAKRLPAGRDARKGGRLQIP